LTALVLLGTWQRHPWRYRFKLLHPELRLGAHAALGLATIVLMLGHVLALVLDRYAGVGWRGALLPGAAHYRPGAVTIGVLAAYGMLAVTLTARFAGRLTGRHWLTVHRLGVPIFGAVWAHGLLAGTDTPALRWLYATTGLLVVSLLVSRFAARPTVLPTGVS
jgi:DMSO/TMAO reductase YedYZ heme-binding membrane subunit